MFTIALTESEKRSSSTVTVAILVPLLFVTALALAVVLVVLIVVFFRRRSAIKNFEFQTMSHRELEEKDLENFLETQQGSLPSTKSGVITGSEGVCDGEKEGDGSGNDGNNDFVEKKLYDVDFKNGHLV